MRENPPPDDRKLDELITKLAKSERERESLRLLAAKRQRQVRSLALQLRRHQEQARRLRTRLRDEQRVSEALSEEREHALRESRDLLHWLNEIYASRVWRLASIYYRLVTETPLKAPYDFFKMWRRGGPRYALETTGKWLAGRSLGPAGSAGQGKPSELALMALVQALSQQRYSGVCIVASTFAFDATLNQRPIRLATSLASRGLAVIYIAWRWSRHELAIPVGQEVSKNVFQVPVDVFLEYYDCFQSLDCERKSFMVQFPYPRLLAAALALKQYGFRTIYEILDNWEEFHRANQAPWYVRDAEQALVLNSDLITAVSEPLKNKFSSLRVDIELVPNGYDPESLGARNRNIALPFSRENELNIGYFGHLTDSWFDWDLLLEILALASQERMPVKFHIIGYGEPRHIRSRIRAHQSRVVFHGRVPTSELYQHVTDWDAGIIPFKKGALSESVDPIKLYEYLYFGLPVMVSGIPHLAEVPRVHCFENAAGFLRTLRNISRQPMHADAGNVENFLRQATWEERVSRLTALVQARPLWKCL